MHISDGRELEVPPRHFRAGWSSPKNWFITGIGFAGVALYSLVDDVVTHQHRGALAVVLLWVGAVFVFASIALRVRKQWGRTKEGHRQRAFLGRGEVASNVFRMNVLQPKTSSFLP